MSSCAPGVTNDTLVRSFVPLPELSSTSTTQFVKRAPMTLPSTPASNCIPILHPVMLIFCVVPFINDAPVNNRPVVNCANIMLSTALLIAPSNKMPVPTPPRPTIALSTSGFPVIWQRLAFDVSFIPACVVAPASSNIEVSLTPQKKASINTHTLLALTASPFRTAKFCMTLPIVVGAKCMTTPLLSVFVFCTKTFPTPSIHINGCAITMPAAPFAVSSYVPVPTMILSPGSATLTA